MKKASPFLAIGAVLALAACETPQQEARVPLVDQTGRTVATAPASVLSTSPVGTQANVQVQGEEQQLTVGRARAPGISAGAAAAVGTDQGGQDRVAVRRTTRGRGTLGGQTAPTVTGTTTGADGSGGRPVTQ
ncbi:hypothetical protein EOD42_17415 [Rhodovarius crocodyli]|uniref:Uncharacterized protein n=1 Tax=Rhodovarius crocodyli TaxID=1979269 RepID=A0A437MCJ1_9PROT|nr:hypothetical protein [Rhodovarius crocodyli]RVT95361.1 hypothetical protein EOD42_17415 [Rhodovarius crocodyli]